MIGRSRLPAHWKSSKLSEVFETQLGKMLSPKARVGASPKPYLRNANVQWGHVECSDLLKMDFDERESKKFRLNRGDILVCEGGEIGRTAVWRDEISECYFQKAIHRLRPRNGEILPEFFQLFMEYAFRIANIYGIAGTQTTIAHLPQDKLNAMLIPIPPQDEQQFIARILNEVRDAIEARRRELALERERKAALMQHLLTHGTRGEPLKQTEIGEMPESWKVVKLGTKCTVKTSFPSFNLIAALDTKSENDELVLALKVSDMNRPQNRGYITDSQLAFRYPGDKAVLRKFLQPNSLVFPKRGAAIGTNKKRVTRHLSILDPNLIGIEPSNEFNSDFLFGFFERFDLRSLQDNNPIPQLNKNDVELVSVPFPPLEEQREIASVLRAIDIKVAAIIRETELLDELFKAMLEELMTGRLSAVPLIEGAV